MSVLTYVVIAKPSDAREVGEDFLSKKFVWLDYPAFDPYAVEALHSVLSGSRVSSKATPPEKILPLLYQRDPLNGCWVYQIPDDWVKLFAQMEEKKIPATTKQMIQKSWLLKSYQKSLDVPSVEKHMYCLRDLSKRAIKEKTSLLLFVSL